MLAMLAAPQAPAQTVQTPAIDLSQVVKVPVSTFPPTPLAPGAAAAQAAERRFYEAIRGMGTACTAPDIRIDQTRQHECLARTFYETGFYRSFAAGFRVAIAPATIDGVFVERFIPAAGIAPRHRGKVLVNLHGGGFLLGGRWQGRMESMPVADWGRFEVVSVDYAMTPYVRFPAATQDVLKVYRALLRTHRARDIGIYGCSAGGLLTAQATAAIAKAGLPAPGAIGLFCSGAAPFEAGDSARATLGPSDAIRIPYLIGLSPRDPDAFPFYSDAALARFPPALLISGTRDPMLSSVVATHAALVRLGVDADLHVWEGMGHGFYVADPMLADAREAYRVMLRFFDAHLGARPTPRGARR